MPILELVEPPERISGEPGWIEQSLNVTPGRDPLGLQTITLDRIMPALLPGILVLSQRARYFSFHAFLLSEYQRLRLPATNANLSTFVKLREYEFALALQLCTNGCGAMASGVVGKTRAGPAAGSSAAAFERAESVESALGGYGLYYRSPMIDLGIVLPRGTELGETVLSVDVLDPHGPGMDLAEAFTNAIRDTAYFADHMHGTAPIPREVLAELGERSCLCRLADFPEERELLRKAVMVAPSNAFEPATEQRRRSFGLLFSAVDERPDVMRSNHAFREAAWEAFVADPTHATKLGHVRAQWAALAAKEYWQEALSSIWSHFLRVAGQHPDADGLTPAELDVLLREELVPLATVELPNGSVGVRPAEPTTAFATAVAKGCEDRSLEQIRSWAVSEDSATAGLCLLVVLLQRLPDAGTAAEGWMETGLAASERQPSLLRFAQIFTDHVSQGPTVADTIGWLVRRFIVAAHEQIAYAKLPEFTFRFRWEGGRLRFYSLGPGRFDLADMRRQAMARISQDLGYWTTNADGVAGLTGVGSAFVAEVFAE